MLILIFAIAAILRLISINQSLWLDEAISLAAAQNSVHNLIFNFAKADFHPPLYYIILRYWIQFTSSSEIFLRIPSVIFGIGLVFTTFLIAKNFFDKKTAHIAAILTATSPILIYYSQEARMYMATAFFVSLSFYFFIQALEHDRLTDWLGFILVTIVFLYLDYVPYFMLVTYIICASLYNSKKSFWRKSTFIPALLLVIALIIPWIYIFTRQFNFGINAIKSSPAWAQVLGEATGKNLLLVFVKFAIGRISIQNHLIYGLFSLLVLTFVLGLFILYLFRLSRKRSLLLAWFLTPLILGFMISFYIPVFSYFRFIFCVAPLYIILASGINNINWTPMNRTLLAIMLVINLTCSIVYLTNPKFQREDWRSAINFLKSQVTPKSEVLFEMENPPAPFVYYAKGQIRATGVVNSLNAQNEQISSKINAVTKDKNTIYLFQYLSQVTDPQGFVFANLTKAGFVNIETKDFPGVGFIYTFRKS